MNAPDPAARPLRTWLLYGGLSAAVAVSIVLSFIVFYPGQTKSDEKAAKSSAGASPQIPRKQSITGDCNAQGQNIRINCVFPPASKSLGKVTLEYDGAVHFLFAGAASELPVPPDYPAEAARGHCDEWGDWLSRQPRIYAVAPQILLNMMSGQPDLVVVRKVEPQVFRRTPLTGEKVLVQCKYGAGANPGYWIRVRTSDNTTQFGGGVSDDLMQMPPASLSLKGREYESASISIVSSPGVLYEGMLTVTAMVNGEEQKILLGTPSRPFRWLGGELGDPATSDLPTYDWDVARHQWTRLTSMNPPGQG